MTNKKITLKDFLNLFMSDSDSEQKHNVNITMIGMSYDTKEVKSIYYNDDEPNKIDLPNDWLNKPVEGFWFYDEILEIMIYEGGEIK